jgi:hypothetical protein
LAVVAAVGGCHEWRPASAPVPAVVAAGAALRVTTRPVSTGVAHRYVLRSPIVNRDSLVGFVTEESLSLPGGGWGSVSREPGTRRVSVATADIVEVSRSETSAGRTALVVVGAVVAVAGAVMVALFLGG